MKNLRDILEAKPSLKDFDPTARSQRNMTKGKRSMKIVHELSMNNEGHAFYTDYLEGDIKNAVAKMKKAVAALNKNVPGGTWSVTVDGKEI